MEICWGCHLFFRFGGGNGVEISRLKLFIEFFELGRGARVFAPPDKNETIRI